MAAMAAVEAAMAAVEAAMAAVEAAMELLGPVSPAVCVALVRLSWVRRGRASLALRWRRLL
eukprot:5892103-Pleurochrysis_carterae.AAC.1